MAVMRRIATGLVGLAAGAVLAAPMLAWQNYSNVRYGYSICYPRDLLRPGPVSTNGDGRAFAAADGAKLLVWGSNDPLQTGYAGELAYLREDMRKAGAHVRYDAHGQHWGVVSGNSTTRVFYQKTFERGGQTVTFRFEYPRQFAAKYDPVTAKLSGCFKPGSPAF